MVTNVMSDLEKLVVDWLFRHRINFDFQTSLGGGIYELGGSVVDFILPDRNLALRVMGEYWHQGVEKTGSDVIQREQLEAMGWTVIDLLSDDLENRLDETMRLALQGQEMLK